VASFFLVGAGLFGGDFLHALRTRGYTLDSL
jgi:hypothetical protein